MKRRVDLAIGAVLAGVALTFLAPVGDSVRIGMLVAAGLAGLVGVVAGNVVHRPRPRLAWWAMTVAASLFLAGLVVRPWALGQVGVVHFAADAIAVTGYLCVLVALVTMLRSQGGLHREVVSDVLLLTLAGALASLRLLVLPGIAYLGTENSTAVLAGLYPFIDVVLLGLATDLLITSPRRPVNRWLGVAVLCLLGGDLTYSWAEAGGGQLPPPPVMALYAAAFLSFGAAAIHPSHRVVAAVTPTERDPHEAWTLPRLVLLGISLAAIVGLTAWPAQHYREVVQTATAVTLVLAFGLLIFRAVSAVNGQARVRAVLHRRASHDALTDLANRGEVDRRAAQMLATPAPAGSDRWVLFCDLDGFKKINDRWGHGAGDELLRLTARRLVGVVGPSAVVGRLSGDEFVVLTTGTATEVENLAEAVLDSLGDPAALSMAEVVVTGSVGLARIVTGADDALRDADAAMYRAKGLGRNRWAVFDESMRSDVGDLLDLEVDLRKAVVGGSFEVAYQPVVDILDGRPRGAEALLRWDRPGHGPVSPAEFVPVLEDAGLIREVGRLVLTRAVDQLARWRRTGVVDEAFTMSVNVSPRQLAENGFAGDLANLLHAHRLPGSAVVLELTESSMLEGDDATLSVLHELRGLGVELAVDDFGTGYSALSYLRDFPVTRVKVDRSFVNGIGRSERDEEVVRAVVAVSKALGLGVTAEGVETAVQRDALRAMGVVHGQGWLWCKALSAEQLEPLLREQVPGPYTRVVPTDQAPGPQVIVR